MKNNPNPKRAPGNHNGAQAQGNQRNSQSQNDYRPDRNYNNHMNRQANAPQVAVPQITPVNMAQNSASQNISNMAAMSAGPQQPMVRQSYMAAPPGQNPPNIVPTVPTMAPHIVTPGQIPIPIRHNIPYQHAFPPPNQRLQQFSNVTRPPPASYNPNQRATIPPPMMPANPQIPGAQGFPQFYPVAGQQAYYPQFQAQPTYFQPMPYATDMGAIRPAGAYQMNPHPIQPPQQQEYKKRIRKPLVVYNEDGSEFKLAENFAASASEKDKSAQKESSANKEEENKASQNETNNVQEHPKATETTESTEANSAENACDVNVDHTPVKSSVDAPAHDTSVTLGKVDTKCDKAEVADADKDAVDALAEKLNSTQLNEATEEIITDNASPDTEAVKATKEVEPDDKSLQQQSVEFPKREMTPSDQNQESVLEPEESENQVKESQMSTSDPLDDNDSKPRPRVYNREELMKMMDLAKAHPLPDNFALDVSKKNTNPADSLLPRYANRSGSGNDYLRRTPMNAGRRPQGNKFQDRNRKTSNVPMSGDMANSQYTPSVDAWKPDSLAKSNAPTNSEEAITENLLKDVRSILNKLTPQNYEDLLKQFRVLKIDSKDRLKRVIDRIFEKAVIEPAFVVQYAGFCSELVSISVEDPDKPEGRVSFKNLLIKKCEETFNEKMYSDIENYEERIKQIETCDNPAKKKELEEILDEDKRYSRKRSVGNIKLIAELYKINMLNTKIMCGCFTKLLQTNHEDYIECLCTLITNIGQTFTSQIKADQKNFESNSRHFNYVFEQLNQIYQDKHPTISVSSRVRFMILDLIDLRNDSWKPRRKTEGPKKLAQVHQDLENEERRKKAELEELRKNKRISTTYSGPPSDGWQNVVKKKSNPPTKLPISFANLTNRTSLSSKPGDGFKSFAQGSHGGASSNSQSRSSSSNFENQNKFSQLSDTKAYHESMNNKPDRRDERKTSDVTGYQTRSDSGTYSERQDSSLNNGLSEEELAKKCEEIIHSFTSEIEFGEDEMTKAMESLKKVCPPQTFRVFVKTIMTCASNSRDKQRPIIGKLFGFILQNFNYNSSEIDVGLQDFFRTEFDDDFPNFWKFAGFTLAHALVEIKTDDKFKSNDIFKHIGDTLSNVTGQNSVKLTDELMNEIRRLGHEDKMKDILHKSSIISNLDPVANDNSAKEFISAYFNTKNPDPKTLLSQFKFKDCDEKTKLDAICAEIVCYLSANDNVLEKCKNEIIKLIAILPTESIINQTLKVDSKMKHPSGLLFNLFSFYLEAKLISEKDLQSCKPSSVQAIQLERLGLNQKIPLLK